VSGMCVVSAPVYLVPAGEVFQRGYGGSTPVAVCGAVVTGGPDGRDDPHYCPDCVRDAIRWGAE
jgi:hypothetical protein